jgi:hypothetical protein
MEQVLLVRNRETPPRGDGWAALISKPTGLTSRCWSQMNKEDDNGFVMV